jgi:hypothetical protein
MLIDLESGIREIALTPLDRLGINVRTVEPLRLVRIMQIPEDPSAPATKVQNICERIEINSYALKSTFQVVSTVLSDLLKTPAISKPMDSKSKPRRWQRKCGLVTVYHVRDIGL